MKNSTLLSLSRCRIFDSLGKNVLQKTVEAVPYQIKLYSKNAVIHFQGDSYTNLIALLSGTVDTLMRDFDGKTLAVGTIRGPDIIAPGILFAEDNTLPVSILAKTDVKLFLLSKSSITRIGKREPDFLLALLKNSGDRIAALAEKLRFSQFTTIRQKIASYLIDCSQKQRTETILLQQSREALAETFGVTRPALSRVFSELCTAGMIQQYGKIVYILRMDELKNLIS